MRISQSKNLYFQKENQRIKLRNEGQSHYQSPPINLAQSSSPETSARVVVLENENITNKIKLVEQNFNSQLNILKLEFEKKLSDVEYKQKHNPQNFQSRNRTSHDFKDLISKHDVLNTRM